MKLIVIRHGESTANITEIMSSGVNDDVYLTPNGCTQVVNAAKDISEDISIVYVSPLKRTVQTAEILSKHINIPKITICDSIREVDYGKYSGRKNDNSLDKIREKQVAGDYTIRFGETGENKYEIEKRILDFLIQTISSVDSSTNVLVVTHGSISSWIGRFVNAATKQQSTTDEVKNADIRKYRINKSHLGKLSSILKETKRHASE